VSRGNGARLRLRREVDARRVPRWGAGAVDSLDSRRGAASCLALVASPPPLSAGEATGQARMLFFRHVELPIWSLTGSCSSTHSRPLPGAPTVGVSNPGGVPGPTSKLSPRAPAQMGRRETEHEGGEKPEGDRRKRGNPRPSCLSRAQVGCACSRGYKRPRGREREAYTSAVPSFPARPTLCKRALDLPFIGVRRGSRCTMGGVAVC
jgi:hypothetical protein